MTCKRLGCESFGSDHDSMHVHQESGRHVSAVAAEGAAWSLQVRAVIEPRQFEAFLREIARVQRIVRAMNEKGVR